MKETLMAEKQINPILKQVLDIGIFPDLPAD